MNNSTEKESEASPGLAELDQSLFVALRSRREGRQARVGEALARGASANAVEDGWTAASLAAKQADPACLEMLALAGARLAQANDLGWTPATLAAQGGEASGKEDFLACLRMIQRHGAPMDEPNRWGRRPAWLAAAQGADQALASLLEWGADPAALDGQGFGLAMAAAFGGSVRCVEELAKAGADLDARDGAGVSPLMAAARDGRLGALQALIEAGAQLDAQNHAGMTALMLAVDDGQETSLEAARMLCEAGADPTIQDRLGRAAAAHAKDPQTQGLLRVQAQAFEISREVGRPSRSAGAKRV